MDTEIKVSSAWLAEWAMEAQNDRRQLRRRIEILQDIRDILDVECDKPRCQYCKALDLINEAIKLGE